MKRKFQDLLASKKALGMFSMIPDGIAVEIVGYAGFDFIIIDEEHTAYTPQETINLIRAAECSDMVSIVRVPEGNEVYVKKALDSGASGIMIPNVANRKMVEDAITFAKFPPEGRRGACPCVRAKQYGGGADYYNQANADVSVIALVEGTEGLANFSDILKTEHLDAICLGPVDLSVSMGHADDMYHPEVEAAIKRMIGEANAAGVRAGVFTMSKEAGKKYLDFGADYLVFGTDTIIFYEVCKDIRDTF